MYICSKLLKGTQCHLHTRPAAFIRVKKGRSLILDCPWASYTGLIMKYNSHLLRQAIIAETSIIDLWHQKLANVNLNQLRQLVEYLNSIDIQFQNKPSFCEACEQGKVQSTTTLSPKDY